MLVKKIIRGAVFGALIVTFIILITVLVTIGNGENWSLISEKQFHASYPEVDYVSVYLVPVLSKLVVEAVTYGGIIGAVIALIKWAFTRDS